MRCPDVCPRSAWKFSGRTWFYRRWCTELWPFSSRSLWDRCTGTGSGWPSPPRSPCWIPGTRYGDTYMWFVLYPVWPRTSYGVTEYRKWCRYYNILIFFNVCNFYWSKAFVSPPPPLPCFLFFFWQRKELSFKWIKVKNYKRPPPRCTPLFHGELSFSLLIIGQPHITLYRLLCYFFVTKWKT